MSEKTTEHSGQIHLISPVTNENVTAGWSETKSCKVHVH